MLVVVEADDGKVVHQSRAQPKKELLLEAYACVEGAWGGSADTVMKMGVILGGRRCGAGSDGEKREG